MDIKVQLNNIRIAPRKSREVADLIRGKELEQARTLLDFTVKRAAGPVLKLLNSAAASARNDFKVAETHLYISKITVDEGPKLKRMFPMSRGRGYPIMKRSSHITLILSERAIPEEKKTKKETKAEEKTKPTLKNKKPKAKAIKA